MPLAGFGWALMHYAVRTEAGSTVRQTFLRLSSFRSLYLIILKDKGRDGSGKKTRKKT